MSVFVDTGVIVALLNERDPRHGDARSAWGDVLAGRHGRAFTSDYVLDEAVTLARRRTRSHEAGVRVLDFLLGRNETPRYLDLLMVTGPLLRSAIQVFERYGDKELGFTDAATVALVQKRHIDRVLSFDRDFDGVVPRVEPGGAPPAG